MSNSRPDLRPIIVARRTIKTCAGAQIAAVDVIVDVIDP
jgi:hypothetical protein